jgi:acyl carrier protein
MTDADILGLATETVRGYCLTVRRPEEPITADTELFGPAGLLDSMGLVSVIVELEQKLSDRAGREISLMDDRALSQTRSPFRTVRSLADYAESRMSDGDAR